MASRAFLPISILGKAVIDFALPPRCAGCGDVIDQSNAFCAPCWTDMDWLGSGGCEICGMPLIATEIDHCARCLAVPPPIARTRAAVTYDDRSRSIALRLKYGRKVALARTMARYMAPLRDVDGGETIIIPVPLHRWRLWWRGFNQAGLVAGELAKAWGLRTDPLLLRRIKRTQPLKGLNHGQRHRAVSGAFKVAEGRRLEGKTIVLIDDVLTSGSTAEACAKALRKAGAERVELICWARVARPAQLMR